jgi:hypothetical protein
MVAEIGLVVGLYVLARLLGMLTPSFAKAVSAAAVVVTMLVLADLAVRIVRPDGIASLFAPEELATSAPKAPSESTDRQSADRQDTGSVTRAGGGSMTTVLGYGFAVAKSSSLHRDGSQCTTRKCRFPSRELLV